MREILFRGKRKTDGIWLQGDLRQWSETRKGICDYSLRGTSEVGTETVGQFTGLIDKNGKKIFEGDIVHVHDRLLQCSKPYHEFDGVIEHKDGSFVIVGEIMTHYRWLDYDVTILGNIHDNPELLEG